MFVLFHTNKIGAVFSIRTVEWFLKKILDFVFDRSFKWNALIDSDHLQFNQLEFYSNFKEERFKIWDKNE